MAVVPYKAEAGSKKEQVKQMFDNIAKSYDFLNHFLSLGIDIWWRKQAVRKLKVHQPKVILDIATGTGDFALAMRTLNPDKIVGVDISAGMLEIGKRKIKKAKCDDKITFELGDSEQLNFQDNTFDAVTATFGVRNYENLEKGLGDMLRVLQPNGTLLILEFSKPTVFPFKQIYNLYFQYLLPAVGKLISNDNSAYKYLPKSVSQFPCGDEFVRILEKVGYKEVSVKPLTFGVCSIYMAKK